MKHYQLLTHIFIRLIALYFLIMGISYISYIGFSFLTYPWQSSEIIVQALMSFIQPICFITIALLLWFFSQKLANLIIGPAMRVDEALPEGEKINQHAPDYLLSMIISVAGFLIFAYSLTLLIQTLVYVFYFEIIGYYAVELIEGEKFKNYVLPIIKHGLLTLLGSMLAFKGKGVLKLLKGLQS